MASFFYIDSDMVIRLHRDIRISFETYGRLIQEECFGLRKAGIQSLLIFSSSAVMNYIRLRIDYKRGQNLNVMPSSAAAESQFTSFKSVVDLVPFAKNVRLVPLSAYQSW